MPRKDVPPEQTATPDAGVITIRGACQNNLQDVDLDLPLGQLVVVTGLSGSGKSSLAFDTIYAEGQRRYVETFSPYARQFLDRMDKPRVSRIEGIPPAIAIDQVNPVRTSRSTVGTMTELADHLKLLYARAAGLWCGNCGEAVVRDTPETVLARLEQALPAGSRVMVSAEVPIPDNFSNEEIRALLARQGYDRIHCETESLLEVIVDRLRLEEAQHGRLLEALEKAFELGLDRLIVRPFEDHEAGAALRFSTGLHCAGCDIDYRPPTPASFSFNSPAGACESCRGFGRTMGIDYGLVIPDPSLSIADGAIKPFQSPSYHECQEDLVRFARKRGLPVRTAWQKLDPGQQQWVIEGEGRRAEGKWYGIQRFFDWLETKAYRMHVRVLLARYRAYTTCNSCHGARLKADSLLWRLGTKQDADAVLDPAKRFLPPGFTAGDARLALLPGLCLHDVMLLPLRRVRRFFADLSLPAALDEATDLLLREIRTRLDYLVDVGLGYLSLDRQSRTLSGGEVQRINLTTALGTSLVNTLFVLDEPTIGLHASDVERIVTVLQRLRDAGNSLLVVEHDPAVMLAADRLIEMGPGPGSAGGHITFNGTPAAMQADKESLTGSYLRGECRVADDTLGKGHPPDVDTDWLCILGARAHNLRDIDVRLPLRRLVCITGVSGSGKSTLIEDILYPALQKLKGKPTEAPGPHREITGHEHLREVLLVDQSPLGKSTRSNPASYVDLLTPIRKAFASLSAAQLRGYTAGTFSFNSGDGRCPTCGGSGFEHVEMQFLSDVYLRCPDCDGKRYRPEVLELRLPPADGKGEPKSIAGVLEMTVSEAMAFFEGNRELQRGLGHLAAVGLSYLRLGQPVTTLSGGEAQRLKLAGQLARSRGNRNLLLLDEPTTGLHLQDVDVLLHALRALLAQGHSLIVVEHNLDVLWAADWLIDLGPGAGEDGGRLVAEGTPRELADAADTATGKALHAHRERLQGRSTVARADAVREAAAPAPKPAAAIRVQHAREHNLKNIDVSLPRDHFSVITGVSGSGKSTLAFNVLFAEGQRRYLESLNAYARQFVQPTARPDVDAISGIPPTVAIEQRTSRGGRKSTVATLTEIYHFLRLLYARLGTQYCPDCGTSIVPQDPEAILAAIMRSHRSRRVQLLAPLVIARKGYYTELARWAARRGYDELRVDGEMVPTGHWPRLDRFIEHDIELPLGELTASPRNEARLRALLHKALELGKGSVLVATARSAPTLYSTRRACPGCGRSFPELDPRLFSFNSRHGWCGQCFGTGEIIEGFDEEQSGEEGQWQRRGQEEAVPCPACHGARLRSEALAVRFQDRSISELSAASIDDSRVFFDSLQLGKRESAIARDAIKEISSRLQFLQEVGLGYLSLDRSATTLSGGEAQRIRLAAQLGSNLRGVCYILDEPTIGLHPRDNQRLLATLRRLRDQGNTVLVVEHDEDTIRQADHVLDLGPGAGTEGGEVVAEGPLANILEAPRSLTGQFLSRPAAPPADPRPPVPAKEQLRIEGASVHNLQKVNAAFPLGRLCVVTGVSGSGKSSLVRHVLLPNIVARLARGKGRLQPLGCSRFSGWQSVSRVLEVDQSPIGKSPRSCPATYTGLWDEVRRIFSQTTEARIRGYTASRFSFNVKGGRCPACKGHGVQRIEMNFLPDVEMHCDSCDGARFNSETLQVRYRGRNIGEVLNMSIHEAASFFIAHRKLHNTLSLLDEVGLGYLRLGQRSPTLSGGEAQRLKLVSELARARPGTSGALYILDEPTVGLHMSDVARLMAVLQRLIDAGNTAVLIEHNLDVIAQADWVIDMGPDGGVDGGRVVAAGPPAKIMDCKASHTGVALAAHLAGKH